MTQYPLVVLPSYLGNRLYTSIASTLADNVKNYIQVNVDDVVYKDFGSHSLRDLQTVPDNVNTLVLSCRRAAKAEVSCFMIYQCSSFTGNRVPIP
jgi:hypothetical protein